jgi:rubredoxin-NAD+ reductase
MPDNAKPTDPTRGTVIVGTGLAGYAVARELRKLDAGRPITVVTRDDGDFYAKPSLSNALAQGKTADALVTTPGPVIARQLGITLRTRTTVDAIDTVSHTLRTTQGALHYDKLVLATGADPIRLALSGDAIGAVRQVNDLDDYRTLRSGLAAGTRVVILGAGLIGSEFANDLRAAGIEVDVVDLAPRPLAALLPDQAGRWFASRLAGAGVRWHFGEKAQAVNVRAGRLELALHSGARLQADLVLSAVGLRPRITVAADAGLSVDRGIRVDRFGATSDPDVFALGDCAQYEGRLMPYVQPIMVASRAIAATLAGTETPIAFGPMPVVVKTPACPVTVLPPSQDAAGRWESDAQSDALTMRFLDAQDRLQGFALLGAATARRRQLLELLGQRSGADTGAARTPTDRPIRTQ